jgi:hypothetical protein
MADHYRPMLLTAAFTDLRVSELRGLKWSDVDLKKGKLQVRRCADRYGDIGGPSPSRAGARFRSRRWSSNILPATSTSTAEQNTRYTRCVTSTCRSEGRRSTRASEQGGAGAARSLDDQSDRRRLRSSFPQRQRRRRTQRGGKIRSGVNATHGQKPPVNRWSGVQVPSPGQCDPTLCNAGTHSLLREVKSLCLGLLRRSRAAVSGGRSSPSA